jgi:hypothetical protein
MRQPKGFLQTNNNNFVCKLNKFLYDLKQSLQAWFAHIDTYLLQNGFE